MKLYMRVYYSLLSVITCLSGGAAFADSNADILLGYWQAQGKSAIVELQKAEDGGYSGTVVANAEKPEAVGTEVFKELQYDAAKKKWNGVFHVLARDKDAKAHISSTSPDSFEMKVKMGFVSRTIEWQRVPAPAVESEE